MGPGDEARVYSDTRGTYHVYDLLKVEEVIASEGVVLTVHKSEKLWREKQEGREEEGMEVKRGK